MSSSFLIRERALLAGERDSAPGGVACPPSEGADQDRGGRSGQALRVLVVDDEEAQRRILRDILESAGYQVESASGIREALGRLEADGVDLVLTDLKMPGGSGLDLLEEVKESNVEVEVILMTAFSSVETAVEAMRRGAFHYLPKPFDRGSLLSTVEQVCEKIRLRRENRQLKDLVSERFRFDRMLGKSKGMQEVFRTIEKVHSNPATVLIRGESGTGKELVARAIHSSGNRSEKPFVAINCAAIPDTLIESELFGHERGAFTGALNAKIGRFEEVGDGTLFLDEIGSMQYDLQAKLLRVIQEREFQRVGGHKILDFRARLVAATSQDLEELVRDNRFREDLYFRLNVVPIELPPLRGRAGDLPLLAAHFVRKYSEQMGKKARGFSPALLDLMESYDWPGNVRELENVVQRMVVLADDATEVLDAGMAPRSLRQGFPTDRGGSMMASRTGDGASATGMGGALSEERARNEGPGAGGAPPGSSGVESSDTERDSGGSSGGFRLPAEGIVLADVEADLIRQALERSQGKLEPAAKLLGISYKTLQYRVKKYSLQEWQR